MFTTKTQTYPPNAVCAAYPLAAGRVYKISGLRPMPDALFIGWGMERCQLHGEKLGWRAVFQKVKVGGKLSYSFAINPAFYTFSELTNA